jgi:hypothetical protein
MEWWQVAGLGLMAWIMITLWRDAEPGPQDNLDEYWIDVGGEG